MITVDNQKNIGTVPFEYRGLSTDTKPVEGVPENSLLLQLDTDKFYYFSNGSWKEVGK